MRIGYMLTLAATLCSFATQAEVSGRFQSDGIGYSCYQTSQAAILNAETRSELNATSTCGTRAALRRSDWRVNIKGCSVTVSAEFQCYSAARKAPSTLTGFALAGFDGIERDAAVQAQELACEAVGNTEQHSISFKIVGNKFTFDDRGTGDFPFLISYCGEVTAGSQNELLLGALRSSVTDSECTPVSGQPQSGSGIFVLKENSNEGHLNWIAGPQYSEIQFKCGSLSSRRF